jgi:alpha-mannosidase
MFPNRRRLVFSAELPAFGYRLYRMSPEGLRARRSAADQVPPPARPKRRSIALAASVTMLENSHLRMTVDPGTGWLATLEDKAAGTSLLAAATGPHAVAIVDESDTWSHRQSRYDGPSDAFVVDSIRLVENGPVRAIIRVEQVFGRSRLTEELVLGRESTMLEVRVTLDWLEPLRLLKLRVGSALANVTTTFDVGYGHIVRPADGHEVVGQRWIDVSGVLADGRPAGLSIINDGKYAFDIDGGNLGITAARSPVYAWHEPSRLDPDGIYDYQDQGRQVFRYALLPHAGDWRAAGTVRAAESFNQSPIVHLESAHPGVRPPSDSLVSVDAGSVVVGVVKRSEDSDEDVIVRGRETAGMTSEAVIDLPFLGRSLTARFEPHQIRTFRVPRDPACPVAETDLLERPLEPSGRGRVRASRDRAAAE